MEPFAFKSCSLILRTTGTTAVNLRELHQGLRTVPAESVEHHVLRCALTARFGTTDYPNDFALWAARALHDRPLAERLANIDPFSTRTVEALRERLLEILEDHLWDLTYVPWARTGMGFPFMRSQMVVFDTGLRAASVEEFARRVKELPSGSLYYHFFEGRRRLGRKQDDFSQYLADIGAEGRILRDLAQLDFYFYTLEQLRTTVYEILVGGWAP